jgi:hypothetical protein
MNNEVTIEDYNCIIDEFMGKKVASQSDYYNSWDKLMPVIEKIEAMSSHKDGYYGFYMSSNSATIQGTKFAPHLREHNDVYFIQNYGHTKIVAAFETAVQFILWYNKNKDERGIILR